MSTPSTPGLELILTDDKRADMNYAAFKKLLVYNTSLPTGTTIGKRWRALYRQGWFMGEYVRDPSPTHVGIKWREIWIMLPGSEAVRATEEQFLSWDSQERLIGEVVG